MFYVRGIVTRLRASDELLLRAEPDDGFREIRAERSHPLFRCGKERRSHNDNPEQPFHDPPPSDNITVFREKVNHDEMLPPR